MPDSGRGVMAPRCRARNRSPRGRYHPRMHRPSNLHFAQDRAFYRPEGQASAGELADMITTALGYFHEHGYLEVVVNITRMEGFESPGAAFRRWLVRRWARAVNREVAIVVVARAEHISPERTGVIVAAEEGLRAHVCTGEEEAVAWLEAVHAVRH